MSNSNKFRTSSGNDFEIVKADRAYGGVEVSVLKVNGATGALTAAQKLTGSMLDAVLLGFGTAQALTGVGAVNVTSLVTLVTTTGVAQALTIANGLFVGQIKIVHHTVDGGSAVLTPASAGNFATYTLTNVHDAVVLMWTGSAWNVILNVGGTIA